MGSPTISSAVNLYKEKFWRADVFIMKNHQTNKETVLEFSDWNFDANFSRDDFTQYGNFKIRRPAG